MLLVIDVGNTNTVIGVYENDDLKHDWRIRTVRENTADEFNVLAQALFSDKGMETSAITKIVISSVVPSSVRILNAFCQRYLNLSPVWINPRSVKKLMPILYSNPNEVGADRIVNAVAAFKKHQQALIIIDFGTATTFDAITQKGEYLGGAICPGVMISSEALFQRASRLPRVEIFKAPEQVIGKDTIESIQSGIIYGNAAMVDGMVSRMAREMDSALMIIATGGLAPLIAEVSQTIEYVDQSLTLEGLRIISREI
ncbi:MAG: type III pantothenate kinase [Desulfobacter sp.]|nr:type III pantothenate kinase [Desulfobacter sp.]WDP83938.1 MAG: type III pantothenate kinase [Desulfobacter sp.]